MRITDRKESPMAGLTGLGGGLASYVLFGGAATPKPGDEYGGGYFAGQILDSGTYYDIIVAPKSAGGLSGNNNGTKVKWSTSNGNPGSQFENEVYGGNNHSNGGGIVSCTWFYFTSTGPNAGNYAADGSKNGTGIGGFNDWYLPARYELEVVYYGLKPTTNTNASISSPNPYAVPSRGAYTSTDPGQTASSLFQSGGSEAFEVDYRHWSSTMPPYASNPSFKNPINFSNGDQALKRYSDLYYVRAIRRQPSNPQAPY